MPANPNDHEPRLQVLEKTLENISSDIKDISKKIDDRFDKITKDIESLNRFRWSVVGAVITGSTAAAVVDFILHFIVH